MTARALAGALSAVAALALCASAQAQNSFSFIDAAQVAGQLLARQTRRRR